MSEEIKVVAKPSLFGMIFSPTEQLQRIKAKPLIWGAMGIISILSAIASYFMTSAISYQEQFSEFQDLEMLMKISNAIGGLFVPIFSVLFSSFIYWIIIKIARSETMFKQLFSMNTYIMFIYVLGELLNGILTPLLNGDGMTYITSLASIVDAEGATLGLLRSIEVFTIWGVILSAFGLHIVGNLSKRAAWIISIVFYVLFAIISIIGASFESMIGV